MLKNKSLFSLSDYLNNTVNSFNLSQLAHNLFKRYIANLIFLQLNRWNLAQQEFPNFKTLTTQLTQYLNSTITLENDCLKDLISACNLTINKCKELVTHNIEFFLTQQVLFIDSVSLKENPHLSAKSYQELILEYTNLYQNQTKYLQKTLYHNYFNVPKHHLISNLPQFFSFINNKLFCNGMCFTSQELNALEELNKQWCISANLIHKIVNPSIQDTHEQQFYKPEASSDYFLNLVYYSIDSTHLTAQRELESFSLTENYPINATFLLYVALHQSNGQGTKNRHWYTSSFSDLAMTLVTPVTTAIAKNLNRLSLKTTTAIHQVLKHHFAARKLLIKWPNDLYGWNEATHNHAKLLGFLTNIEKKCLLIGIGANISAKVKDFQLTTSTTNSHFVATCLNDQQSQRLTTLELVSKVITIADQVTSQIIFNISHSLQLLNYYRKYNLYQIGDDVFRLDNHQHYKVVDFGETGWISLLNDNGETEEYSSASITLRKV